MILTMTFHHHFLLQVYAAPFQLKLLIFIEKNLSCRVLKASKKQVPLKSHYLRIRIDSVNQILKNKEKVKWAHNINIRTRITDQKILCVYIYVYHLTKNWGPGPYNSLRHTDNRKYFSGQVRNQEIFRAGEEFSWNYGTSINIHL